MRRPASLILIEVRVRHERTLHGSGKRVGEVTGLFRRGLSDALIDDLMDGPCAAVFRACVSAGLYVRLRANAVNLYVYAVLFARMTSLLLARLPVADVAVGPVAIELVGARRPVGTGRYVVFEGVPSRRNAVRGGAFDRRRCHGC